MFGGTLRDLRERIADRHEDDGRYYVNCARTGERPVPVADKRFPTRETAVAAAELAGEYRAELRRYDPRLPHYDLVVSEAPGTDDPVDSVSVASESFDSAASSDSATASASVTSSNLAASPDSGSASDFCHDVSAAVFEALSELGETSVERAALEAYLHSAESVTDPDELCLVLLATMATEIDARLDPDRQGAVLRAAADRLATPSGPGTSPTHGARSGLDAPGERSDPMTATLARLDGHSLVGDYAVSEGEARSGRSWTISVEEYAFDSVNGNVPTLPLAVELLRHLPDETIAVADLRATGNSGWECVVSADAGNAQALSLATPENV
jgi:hypothetical protein